MMAYALENYNPLKFMWHETSGRSEINTEHLNYVMKHNLPKYVDNFLEFACIFINCVDIFHCGGSQV